MSEQATPQNALIPHVSIDEDGFVAVRLTPALAGRLTKVLERVSYRWDNIFETEQEETDCALFAALFRAATLAGVAYANGDPAATSGFRRDLVQLGLEEG
jgi:hypothetical protein